MRQQVGRAVQSFVAALSDSVSKVFGVLVNDDRRVRLDMDGLGAVYCDLMVRCAAFYERVARKSLGREPAHFVNPGVNLVHAPE